MNKLVMAAAATLLQACATGPNEESILGQYVLATIDGRSLPFPIVDQCGGGECVRLEVVGAEITLQAGGTATVWDDSRYTSGTNSTTDHSTGSGTYSLDGQTISFAMHGLTGQGQSWSLNSSGTLAGGAISLLSAEGFLYRYTKR